QDYPITKEFSRKWSYFLLVFGVLSVAAFSVINIFSVGYDVVSITTTNFNSTHGARMPWPWTSSPGSGCEPHQFQLGDTFRTNISAFSYSIFDVAPSNPHSGSSVIQGGFPYANNDISSCDVVAYEIVVKPGDRLITTTAGINCPLPLGFRAVTSWRRVISIYFIPPTLLINSLPFSYSNHPIIGSISKAVFPRNSLARAILDAMGSIADEAYWDIYNGKYVTNATALPQPIYKVIAHGEPSCDSICTVGNFSFYDSIGNTALNILPGPKKILADEGNLYNMIKIFYAAVRLDLGHWTADNLFTNTTSFNNSIVSTQGSQDDGSFRSIGTSKGLAYINLTTPPPASARTSRAVVQIPYTCNVMQRKTVGSFIVSVLSGTMSMFLGTWGVLISVLSGIARKNPGGTSVDTSASSGDAEMCVSANTCDSGVSNVVDLDNEHRRKPIPLPNLYSPISKSDNHY
ncbi:hypothetical protein B0H17DRAFT_1256561, partial [Mycena rosella]